MSANAAPAAAPALAIVAGMHRAGTSAIARALAVLGFDLGPRLMSADARMNARGFFEDLDIVALDDALLAHCGADWKSVALLADADFADAALTAHAAAARALLAARLAPTGRFACKDPRMPRVLPFWQRALRDLGLGEGYVIAVRHPAAVIASLAARDGLDARRSAWLWLTHVACALAYTHDRPRVVVDYDRLLADPARELARIAAAFGLPAPAADDPAVVEFRDRFLSAELRHAHVESDVVDPAWPPLVADAHALTVALAAAPGAVDAAADAPIAQLWARLRACAPLLGYAGEVERVADDVPRLAGELAWARDSLAQAQGFAADLQASLAAKDADLVALRTHATASAEAAATYAASLRAALAHAEGELAVARRTLGALGATRAGRGLLRWLARRDRGAR
ncbi:MAG: hypothetical protein IT522_02825 [Burkholderiales bacterium]|nr:hypothetical protein [Burkholderiales bacterium]